MNDIQKSIFGYVVPANGSPAEDMRCIADSVDTLEVEIEPSCMEDGDALHSVFAESSMSSQGSDLLAEILGILATPQYDDLANQVTNTPVFPQERSAESSMSFQGSNPFAEQATNIQVFPQERSAESSTSSQGSDPSAEEARNRHAFPQKRSSESSMSSQGSDPPVRKKIKCNDAGSSEPQQVQSKNADTAYSKTVCVNIDGKKLNINGRIIGLGSKETMLVKLLIEKINTYVPTDDLYVAVYGGKAGDWYKSSKKEKKRFYSLLDNLRKKLPEDSLKGGMRVGYMLSDSVMTSQDSNPLAEEATNLDDAILQPTSAVASTSSQGFPSAREEMKRTPVQNKMVYFSGIGMNIEKNELEIDGESFIFKSQNFMVLKLLFERMNTYVSLYDLYVAAYGEDKACQRLQRKKQRPYELFYPLHNRIPEGYTKGNLTMGYMLFNPNELVDVSYQGFSNALKRTKGTDDSDSSEVSESEEDGCNLQEVQYDRENYPLISDCYTDDYDQFVKDNKSIRRRYINVQRGVGFVRIGEIYVSFIENNVMIDGGSISLSPREIQSLRLLVLWYPDVVSYEQIYYNLSFCVNEDYACFDKNPEIRKHYLYVPMHHVQVKLRSATDSFRISSFKKKGYSLVCHPKRQACPNESSV
jgi:DNA-binding winged helix-turn-helix (wHTH) protein